MSLPASLSIYYATESGNSSDLAYATHERALKSGWADAVADSLGTISVEELAAKPLVLFIVSTWGDGDPPSDAIDFFEALEQSTTSLSGLRYAILGLGDSGYPDFNGFSRKLEAQLAARGAQKIMDRVEADVDFDEPYNDWVERVFDLINEYAAVA